VKSNYLIGTRSRDLPACSIMPQPTTLPINKEFLRGRLVESGTLEDREEVIPLRTEPAQYYIPITNGVEPPVLLSQRVIEGYMPFHSSGFPPRKFGFEARSGGIRGGRSDTGAHFLRILQFPLPNLIRPTPPHSTIIRDSYNRPISGRRTKWTQSHPHPPKNKKKNY
jgi:hypothetical protein